MRTRLLLLWTALLTLSLAQVDGHGATVYVDVAGSGAQDGSSWADVADLPTALAGAASGDELWVKNGIYKPAASDRDVAFVVPAGVSLYGGFVGNEATRGARDWLANVTIISGDLASNDSVMTFNDENSLHLVVLSGDNTLDGFTVSGANNNLASSTYGGGAAVVIIGAAGSSGKVANCFFRYNSTAFNGGAARADQSGWTFDHCVFTGNRALATFAATDGSGGALIAAGSAVVTDCFFSGNRAATSGGALVCTAGTLALSNCVFSDNRAVHGGALDVWQSAASGTVDQCTFYGNLASAHGGAICAGDFSGLASSGTLSLTVTATILWGDDGASGSEVFAGAPAGSATVDVHHCVVKGGASHLVQGTGAALTSSVLATNDPLFVDVASPNGPDSLLYTSDDGFNIGTGSGAIDLAPGAGGSDLIGTTRPQNAANDAGAYEFIPSSGIVGQPSSGVIYLAPGSTAGLTASGGGCGMSGGGGAAAIILALALFRRRSPRG